MPTVGAAALPRQSKHQRCWGSSGGSASDAEREALWLAVHNRAFAIQSQPPKCAAREEVLNELAALISIRKVSALRVVGGRRTWDTRLTAAVSVPS